MNRKRVLIIGGGAAGYFAAITIAEQHPNCLVCIAESSNRPLQKVAISGGGRCNVTQACFDERRLVEAYPRGKRELRGPFSRFQPRDTVAWFQNRGVRLKTEEDGRMFPTSDSSKTIINCFEKARTTANIELRLRTKVLQLRKLRGEGLEATLRNQNESTTEQFDAVVMACGGSKSGYQICEELGHHIETPVPSLFTFEVNDKRLSDLSGVSVARAEITLSAENMKPLSDTGPLLVTHWGFSGPAIIRLSAWGARPLCANKYQAKLTICWCPDSSKAELSQQLDQLKREHPRKLVLKTPALELPKRLWESLCLASGITEETRFAELRRAMATQLEAELFEGQYQISGKGVFKEEFVTCGGVSLREVDMRSMESKLVPGLFFAGEILDIDGITGGYNFQSAWTTGFIAGSSIAEMQSA